MAEPIVCTNSPLAEYLRQNLDSDEIEQSSINDGSNEDDSSTFLPAPPSLKAATRLGILEPQFFKVFFHPLSKFKYKFLFLYRSLLGLLPRCPLFASFFTKPRSKPNHLQPPSPGSISDPGISPSTSPSTDSQRSHLSERLKYLICSSFLLNPGLQPALYEALSTPTQAARSGLQPDSLSTLSDDKVFSSARSPLAISSIVSRIVGTLRRPPFIQCLYRSQAAYLLASALAILLGLCTLPSFTIFCLPFFALASNARLRSRSGIRRYFLQPTRVSQVSPNEELLSTQSELVSTAVELVSVVQTLDFQITRAFSAVKEIECVALGLSLLSTLQYFIHRSNPMPPISRLERSSFPFALKSLSHLSPPCSPFSSFSTQQISTHDLDKPSKLHAIGLRRLIQTSLGRAGQCYEQASLELMSKILNPSTRKTDALHNSNVSTLEALMDMYGCAKQSSQSEVAPSQVSVAERVRRQTLRASFHAKIANSSPARPLSLLFQGLDESQCVTPAVKPIKLNLQSTPRPDRRFSLAGPPSSTPSIHSPIKCVGRNSRIFSNTEANDGQGLLYANALGLLDKEIPAQSQNACQSPEGFSAGFSPSATSPAPSPSFSTKFSPNLLNRSIPPAQTLKKSRPFSMSALNSSFSTPTYSARSSFPRSLLPAMVNRSTIPEVEEREHDECYDELSLISLQANFENMDLLRKRFMCCLLALEFDSELERLGLWQDALKTIKGVLEVVKDLSKILVHGMDHQFTVNTAEETPLDQSASGSIQGRSEDEYEGAIRDFAPPYDPKFTKKQRVSDFMKQMASMDLALRQLSAKMKLCAEELEEGCSESGLQRAIGVHESIRKDLETVTREWDQGRTKLRIIIGGSGRLVKNPEDKLRPWSIGSLDAGLSSGRESSILDSELLTPVETYGDIDGEEEEEEGEIVREMEEQDGGEVFRDVDSLENRRKKVEEIGLDSLVANFANRDFRNMNLQGHVENNKSERYSVRNSWRRSKISMLPGSGDHDQNQLGFLKRGEDIRRTRIEDERQSMSGMVSELREVLGVLKSRGNQV
ncbi:expressed protein [Phakopsora pachyrhizi]|uniref:Expressed protein n=1 Tax=Phakopsora pachyrhizi TaxID=170000 RepID=A0AAV0AL86_PHAPC|nr:expressed protein [Phakopsora pachyrhizi]